MNINPSSVSPFSSGVEDIFRLYFFEHWFKNGKLPCFEKLHNKIHEEELYAESCPGEHELTKLYEKLKMEIV